MTTLAICAQLKDEPREYLREWLFYHVARGVERFFLYDNESAEPVADQVREMGLEPVVRVTPWPGVKVQLEAYAHFLEYFSGDCRWVGFIDMDEFVVPGGGVDLRELLSHYPDAGGVAFSWSVYSSSGHEARPEGLQIENYTRRFALDYSSNVHIKSFVRPPSVAGPVTPHHFNYKPGHGCVHLCGLPVNGPFCPADWSGGRVNHYYYRSREDFRAKIARGRGHTVDVAYLMEEFEDQLSRPVVEDAAATDVAARVRAMIRQSGPAMVLDMALRYDGRDADYFAGAAMEALGKGKVEAARELMGIGLARYADNAVLWTMRAGFERMRGDHGAAMKALERALGLEPSPEAYHELYKLRLDQGCDEQARAVARFMKTALVREGRFTKEWARSLGLDA